MNKTIHTTILLTILLIHSLSAQSDPYAILAYFENPRGDLIVTDHLGREVEGFNPGDRIRPGYSISTGGGIVEIKLTPNGTILKLEKETEFTLNNLQGFNNSPINEFSLLSGMMRTVAAKTTRTNYYNVRTPTAVVSVWGTDFINEVSSTVSNVVVRQGLVEVIPFSGRPVMISANQKVDTMSARIRASKLTAGEVDRLFNAMSFKNLSPAAVPGFDPNPQEEDTSSYEYPEEVDEETPAEEEALKELAEEEENPDETRKEAEKETTETEPVVAEEQPAEQSIDEPEEIEETPSTTEAPAAPEPPLSTDREISDQREQGETAREKDLSRTKAADILRDLLGMEIGSTTINGQTYSKVIFQPALNLGKFEMRFHLPLVYSDNMFDPSQWYRPESNDEWSFGTDQAGVAGDILLDILHDTMLKIKYMKLGEKETDPFYLSIGNLNDLTIGHGALMSGYGNDSDFPAVRKPGINTGFDLGFFGMELVSDNLAGPSVAGGRLFVNPFRGFEPFQIGVTAIADFFPSRVSETTKSVQGDPWFIAFGLDMEFFEFGNKDVSVMMFGDLSSFLPAFRGDTAYFSAGMPGTDFWFGSGSVSNFGVVAGFRGKVSLFNWSLEYRMNKGVYKPALFDSLYDRTKTEYIDSLINYINDSSGFGTVMGVYGEAGLSLENKILFSAAYYWPWEILDGELSLKNDDVITLTLSLGQELIPRIPLSARFVYERTGLIDTFSSGSDINLFDADTVVSGELIYSPSEVIDLVASVSTAVLTDSDGNRLYETDGLTPQVGPVVNLETRIHF